MTAPMNFRSAINGFKREDVVNYIEYLTAKHTAELGQLNSEIEYLKTRTDVSAAPAEDSAEMEGLKARIDSLLERCAQLEDQQLAAAIEAEDKLRAAEARCAELEDKLQEALDAQAKAEAAAADTAQKRSCHVEQELEAYRRAERAERLAQERAALVEKQAAENAERTQRLANEHAEAVCSQANALLAEASLKVDSAASEVGALADSVMSQLKQLQEAIAQSKQTLRAASDSMYAVHSPIDLK